MEMRGRIIVALDVDSLSNVNPFFVKEVAPYVGCFKLGLDLLTSAGAPHGVEYIHSLGGQVFYDGDFNSTPNKIAGATRTIAGLKVNMFSVHASAGVEAMKAAVANRGFSLVLAVTVLTSLEESSANLIFGSPKDETILRFANYARAAGCDGIICTPQELELLNMQKELDKLLKIVSNVRPSWIAVDGQSRTMIPSEAIKAGATALIIDYHALTANLPAEIGTPIDATKKIREEISSALKEMKAM